jgi:hypothetical protein
MTASGDSTVLAARPPSGGSWHPQLLANEECIVAIEETSLQSIKTSLRMKNHFITSLNAFRKTAMNCWVP